MGRLARAQAVSVAGGRRERLRARAETQSRDSRRLQSDGDVEHALRARVGRQRVYRQTVPVKNFEFLVSSFCRGGFQTRPYFYSLASSYPKLEIIFSGILSPDRIFPPHGAAVRRTAPLHRWRRAAPYRAACSCRSESSPSV